MTEGRQRGRPRVSPGAWLTLGAALLLVANGRWIVPAATWLAPIGWLVFLDRSRRWPGLAIGLTAFVLVQFVSWWGLIPAPGVLYFLIAGVYGVVYFVPFAAHRLLAGRLRGIAATLVLPVAWVAIEFVFQRWVTPYGSWFSLAYTQTWSRALLQLVSVTGTWGVSFLVTWFAAIAALGVAGRRESRVEGRPGVHRGPPGARTADAKVATPGASVSVRRAFAAFALVALAVWSFGTWRLGSASDAAERVRVAGLVPSANLARDLERALAPIRRGVPLDDELIASIRPLVDRLNEDLLERSRREARAGAQVIAWSETAGRVLAEDEADLLRRAGRLAAGEGVTLLLAYGVWNLDAPKPFDNKVVAIDAAGEPRWHYRKAHPIVGGESFMTPAGDGVVRYLDTPQGRVGAVICHDLDFPWLLRQASPERIGLVIGPSADWPAIASMHADMARVRAVEWGFSLLRPTSGGRAIAVDPLGRPAAAVDFPTDAIVAYLPVRPVFTVYGAIGDAFAWLCLAALPALIVAGRQQRPGPQASGAAAEAEQ